MGREKRRQVVSHLEQRWEQVSPQPPPSCSVASAGAMWGHAEKPRAMVPRVVKSCSEAGPGHGVVLAGSGRVLERKAGPTLAESQRPSLGNTPQFPGTWERLQRYFRVSSWLCAADSVSSLTSCNSLKWGTVKAPIWEAPSLEGRVAGRHESSLLFLGLGNTYHGPPGNVKARGFARG